MVTAEKLLELAARCEAANGPDRELDEAIFSALNPHLIQTPHDSQCFVDDAKWFRASKDFAVVGHTFRTQPYTKSIDAALTLVPVEWSEWHAINRGKSGVHTVYLRLYSDRGTDYREVSAQGYSEACARCAAALRARASLLPTKSEVTGGVGG